MERQVLPEVKAPFAEFNLKEFWRMFIDLKRQGSGEGAFDEREPGYKNGMYKAFHKMISSLGQPLSVDLLLGLHDTAIDNVMNMHGELFAKGISNGGASYPLGFKKDSPENYSCSVNGLIQLIDKIRSGENKKIEIRSKFDGTIISYETLKNSETSSKKIADQLIERGQLSVVNIAANKAENVETIKAIIAKYNKDIQQAMGTNEKLVAIVKCVTDLEQAHVFADGNARTMVFLTLNKFLIENGFSPTMVEVPLSFGGLETKELCEMVEKGWETFAQFRKNSNQPDVLTFLEEKFKESIKSEGKREVLLHEEYGEIATKYDDDAVDRSLKQVEKEGIKRFFEQDRKGQTLLHVAAEAGNDQLFLRLLELAKQNGFNLNEQLLLTDKNGENLLHLAIENGSQKMVEAVLENLTPANAKKAILQNTNFGTSALFKAAHNKNPAILEKLLNYFPDDIERYQLLTELKNGLSILNHIAMSGSIKSLYSVVSILGNDKAKELANLPVPGGHTLDSLPWDFPIKKGETAFDMVHTNKLMNIDDFNFAFTFQQNQHTLRDKYVSYVRQKITGIQNLPELKKYFEEIRDSDIGKGIRGEHGFHGLFSKEGNTKHWQVVVDLFRDKAVLLNAQNKETTKSKSDEAAFTFIMAIPKTRVDAIKEKFLKFKNNA